MPETFHKEILLKDIVVLNPNSTVGEGFETLNKHKIRCAPVVDDKGVFVGMFSVHEMIAHLIPVVGELGLNLSFAVGSAPDIADKLNSFFPKSIMDFTDKDAYRLKGTVHTWEALRALTKYGSPLAVVRDGDDEFVGLISEQAVTQLLIEIKESHQ